MTNSQLKRVIREEMTNALGRNKSNVGNRRRLNEGGYNPIATSTISEVISEVITDTQDPKLVANAIYEGLRDAMLPEDDAPGSDEYNAPYWEFVDWVETISKDLTQKLKELRSELIFTAESQQDDEDDEDEY